MNLSSSSIKLFSYYLLSFIFYNRNSIKRKREKVASSIQVPQWVHIFFGWIVSSSFTYQMIQPFLIPTPNGVSKLCTHSEWTNSQETSSWPIWMISIDTFSLYILAKQNTQGQLIPEGDPKTVNIISFSVLFWRRMHSKKHEFITQIIVLVIVEQFPESWKRKFSVFRWLDITQMQIFQIFIKHLLDCKHLWIEPGRNMFMLFAHKNQPGSN